MIALRCADDLSDLSAALSAASLPTDDLYLPGRTFFRFTNATGEVLGFGGYELHGTAILLRSIVVFPERRGQGHGKDIVETLIDQAEKAGGQAAYLLTETSAEFFEALGFNAVERGTAPPEILATTQASKLCPASAHLLRRPIGHSRVAVTREVAP